MEYVFIAGSAAHSPGRYLSPASKTTARLFSSWFLSEGEVMTSENAVTQRSWINFLPVLGEFKQHHRSSSHFQALHILLRESGKGFKRELSGTAESQEGVCDREDADDGWGLRRRKPQSKRWGRMRPETCPCGHWTRLRRH